MYRIPRVVLSSGRCRFYTVPTKVWALTDGGIESSLRTMALARQLGNDIQLKTVGTHKALSILPTVLQSYAVGTGKGRGGLPWYLTGDTTLQDDNAPDYVIASGSSTILSCLHIARTHPKKVFSVYMGFTNLPFIHFDLVTLPKDEANAKMAKLGPLAQQRNCIVTRTPLLSPTPPHRDAGVWISRLFPGPSAELLRSHPVTTIVIGGHSSQCRWYSEDATTLADYMRRMVVHLHCKLVVVFTERTSDLIKENILKGTASIPSHNTDIAIWDTSKGDLTALEKVEAYEALIDHSNRVVLTADMEYATAHASSRRKPVYIAFGGRCRSHILHFHRWARDNNLTRKLRLDRSRATLGKRNVDPFSYLGHHPPFADGRRILDIPKAIDSVCQQVKERRTEKQTSKRASTS